MRGMLCGIILLFGGGRCGFGAEVFKDLLIRAKEGVKSKELRFNENVKASKTLKRICSDATQDLEPRPGGVDVHVG
jgi:hypothetical protein